ncbi:MAG TPA: AAA family ATPase [Pirellulales bacterium]|nr:AAA family ATPase [Pirellulales bacterium]
MYEAFFQLKQRPFAAAPRIDRYFPAPAIEAARQALARCIERAEGAGMLVGPSGAGKTLVCQLLAEQFRQHFSVALLSNGHLTTRRELLQAILFELGLPYRRMEEGELRLSLIDHLSSDEQDDQGLLLLLDEAHTFPIRLLEEVRLITNLVRHGQPRVRLVLAGSPVLEERFASPRLEAFSQRIASRSYLEPFDHAQTRQYVIAQLAAVGGDAEKIFASDALDAVYRATDGVARLVNQVCDHALMLALAGGRRRLTAGGIEEAWADLQQLPTPWNDAGRAERRGPSESGIIEFGGLDDELDADGEESRTADGDDADRVTVMLHQIEEQVTALEEEFRPVATIGPPPQDDDSPAPFEPPLEAEWAADRASQSSDPFAEEFDEEEVLVDRYSAFELASLEERAQVRSQEGQVLSALLTPLIQNPAAPELSLVAAAEPNDEFGPPASAQAIVAETTSFVVHSIDTASSQNSALALADPQPTAEAVRAAFERPARPAENARPAAAAASEPHEDAAEETLAAVDSDLMIVEEDPHPGDVPSSVLRSPQARRLEYRQLFTTLRRG